MDASRTYSGARLKSELARYCLPAANRDPNRKLAWTNSICILFLTIGIVGARTASLSLKPPPPLEQIIPTIVEPPPPPSTTVTPQEQEPKDQDKPAPAEVVVVTPIAPNITFSVPTIGNLVVPNTVAVAPPANPMQPATPLQSQPVRILTSGEGGERPAPIYPVIAKQQGQEGSVGLVMTVNDTGIITDIQIKSSSGSSLLDRPTLEYVKKHWIIPPAVGGTHLYETTINYRLK